MYRATVSFDRHIAFPLFVIVSIITIARNEKELVLLKEFLTRGAVPSKNREPVIKGGDVSAAIYIRPYTNVFSE